VPIVAWAVLALAVAAVGVALGRWAAIRRAQAFAAGVAVVASAIRRAAEVERTEVLRTAEVQAREEARARASETESLCFARETELEERARSLEVERRGLQTRGAELAEAETGRQARRRELEAREVEAEAVRGEARSADGRRRSALERAAGQDAATAAAALRDGEIDEARLGAARIDRSLAEALAGDAAGKRGKRLMGIAMGRFSGHYLTERLHAVVPLPSPSAAEAVIGPDGGNLQAIGEAAGVTLTLSERRDSIRLEGLDGVGREVARRVLARLGRDPRLARNPADVVQVTRDIAAALDKELAALGRRAFADLEIPEAHAEIVNLVGRLNYRTSYTQNQWKHAVEAAFLCGMMADELGLDVKIARRAALMHDIGKALTHALDGSHAVIGADYARRLGESEVVANAIGAHHTDEPFNSAYAYLVAAADALSGARPGARRQTDDNYLARIDDLERITRGFRGVAEAFAVQGGREVRVYVHEDRVDDRAAVDLSSAIAAKISAEMRFPGQIRVTVIRELAAVEVAS
jgi:ribonuclease Y